MSTIAGLVAAGQTITTPAPTDLLWANQGTGSDRDKAITSRQVVEGGLAPAVSAASAATLAATDALPVVQTGPVLKKTTPTAIVPAGFAGTSTLAAAGALDRTETVAVVQAGAAKKLALSQLALAADLPVAIDIAKLTTGFVQWKSAITPDAWSDWGDVVERGIFTIQRTPLNVGTGAAYHIELVAAFKDLANASNAKELAVKIPTTALPAAWFSELYDGVYGLAVGYPEGTAYYRSNESTPTRGSCRAECTWTSTPNTLVIDFGVAWQTIQPAASGSLGTITLSLDVALNNLPATL